MTKDDLPAMIDLQQAGAIVGLAAVFPQDRHPFPRDAIVARWREEIDDPAIDTYVAVDDRGQLVGFAATTGSELLHFGTAIDTWGSGAASELHDVVVGWLRARDGQPLLFVFAENRRARRFYDKHGWQPTGTTRTSSFPPHPLLLEYTLPAV
jgi:RimJ/RimL family protein N-acetyltransferase